MLDVIAGSIVFAVAIALGAIVFLAILAVVYYYNKFVTYRSQIDNAWAQIDVQLKKRFDLVPNLVETVKGYVKHERQTLEAVTKARASMAKAGTMDEKGKAYDMLSGALKSLFAVAEAYPKLRANKNFLMLQEELSGIENKIAYARQFYNDSVMEYNIKCDSFPSSIIANVFNFKKRDYFQVAEAAREPVSVRF